MPIIDVEGLTYRYPGTTEPAVRGMDFAVDQGEIFGFLGPSGAGKSTTQKLLIGLLRDHGGRAHVWNKDPLAWGPDYYQRIGVSFELPNHYLKLTGAENLTFFASLYDGNTLDPAALLDAVGLSDAADIRVGKYSKGMQMRLTFARSLINDPELLFLDEPTSGLDPVNARVVKDMILDLKARGRTVFLTTHDMSTADELCDRVAFVVDGRIVALDSPAELKIARSKRKVLVRYRAPEGGLQQITAIYQGLPDEQFVTRAWNGTRPGMEKLSEFQSTMLPNMLDVLKRGVEANNNAYQGLRKVNLHNRQAIANSNSGIFSFVGNYISDDMFTGVDEARAAVDDMQRLVPGIVSALDGLTIAPNGRVSGSGFGGRTADDQSDAPAPAAPVSVPAAPVATTASPVPTAVPANSKPADNAVRDLASMLKNAMPNTGMGMPMMPQMPQVPNLGSMMPQSMPSAKPAGLEGRELPEDLKAKLADRLKDPDKKDPLTEPGKGKAPEGVLSPQPVAAGQHPGQQRPVTEPASDKPGEQKPAVASNTVEANGRKWTFDNPKLAAMVDGLKSGDGHHSLRQVASDAGFRLPPVGQDIGTEVPTNELKPGNVIMGANNQNGVFLGVGDDGQALAINENGEVKPLHEIAKWDGGPHQGFFKLADDGSPTPQVQEAAGHQPAPAPGAPPAPANPPTPSIPDTSAGQVGAV